MQSKAARIALKRIYEKPAASDGTRILVDRIWPRGVSKANASLDHWLKDIAPSTELRNWFSHDPRKWPEFKKRYTEELKRNTEAVAQIDAILKSDNGNSVTLLFAARDTEHNNAVALRDYLTTQK